MIKNIIRIFKNVKNVNCFLGIPAFYTYIIALSFIRLYLLDRFRNIKNKIVNKIEKNKEFIYYLIIFCNVMIIICFSVFLFEYYFLLRYTNIDNKNKYLLYSFCVCFFMSLAISDLIFKKNKNNNDDENGI